MSNRTKLFIGGLIVLVVAGVPTVMFLRSWVNSDSTGTVSVGKPKGSADTSAAQPVNIDNDWFAAILPAGFSIKSQGADNHNTGDLYGVDATTSGGTQSELTISYETMSGGLDSLGDYHLRATQTSNYAPYTVPGAPAGAAAFRDLNDPYSSAAYVLFWPRGGNCVVIALTGGMGATLDQLNTQFQQLISSWQWK